MKQLCFALILTIATMLSACAFQVLNREAPHSMLGIEGAWQSDAYGYYFLFENRRMSIYDYTQTSCVKSVIQTRKKIKFTNNEVVVEAHIPNYLKTAYKISLNKDQITINREDTVSHIQARKIASLPPECIKSETTDAEYALEVFTKTVIENHSYTEAVNLANGKLRNEDRPKIKDDYALFNKINSIFSQFNDYHALVDTNGQEFYISEVESSEEVESEEEDPWFKRLKLTEKYCLKSLLQYANGLLNYCYQASDVVYLQINSFNDLSGTLSFKADLKTFNEVVDSLFKNSKARDRLIIDLRFNSGGSDVIALELAGKLASEPYLAYKKMARISSEKIKYTDQEAIYVKNSNTPFLGDVVILTSQYTASAAETFILAVLGRKAKVRLIGEPTRGAFSDILPKRLPNGWVFGFSNEIYLDLKDRNLENIGIVPDVQIKQPSTEFEKDLVIEHALTELGDR